MSNELKIFQKFRIRSEELIRDSIEFLIDKFKQSRKMFTVSTVYGQILYVLENLFQLNLFYIEDSISELNVHRASRNASRYSLASLAGQNPTRAIAASGEIKIKIKDDLAEDEVEGGVIVIPNYSRLVCENNNRTYVMVFPSDDIRVTLNQEFTTRVIIYQGRLESQIFTGKGREFDSFVVPYPTNYFIDHFMVDIYVNDVKWKKYDNLVSMPKNAKGYVVRTAVAGGLEVYFGNNKMGNYPKLGDEIRVEYLVTDGFAGRLPNRVPEDVKFSFVDSGFNLQVEEVDLNTLFDISTTVIPDFGANPENINHTVSMISRRNDIFIRTENYEVFLERLDYFSLIRVNTDEENERLVNILLVPDIQKTMNSSLDYFSIPMDRFTLNEEKKNQLLKLIAKMGTQLMSTDIRIFDPKITKYVINVGLVVFEDYDIDSIKSDVSLAISQYFISTKRKDRIPRSDLVYILEKIDGVDSVNVNIIGELNEKAKVEDPTASIIGLDEFNDIIIKKNELPVIRGGWSDRQGNYYESGLSNDNLGALNIRIVDITKSKR